MQLPVECAVCPHASTIHTTLEHSVLYISLLDSMYGFMSNHCQKLKLSVSVSEENWAGWVTQILADLSSFLVLEQQSWRRRREYNKPHFMKKAVLHFIGPAAWLTLSRFFLSVISLSSCSLTACTWWCSKLVPASQFTSHLLIPLWLKTAGREAAVVNKTWKTGVGLLKYFFLCPWNHALKSMLACSI